jgi:hypothetical protein
VEFWGVRKGGGSKAIILNDEHVYVLAEGLAKLRDAMRGGEPVGAEGSRAAERDEKPQDGQAIFQNSIHYTDATTHSLARANV